MQLLYYVLISTMYIYLLCANVNILWLRGCNIALISNRGPVLSALTPAFKPHLQQLTQYVWVLRGGCCALSTYLYILCQGKTALATLLKGCKYVILLPIVGTVGGGVLLGVPRLTVQTAPQLAPVGAIVPIISARQRHMFAILRTGFQQRKVIVRIFTMQLPCYVLMSTIYMYLFIYYRKYPVAAGV